MKPEVGGNFWSERLSVASTDKNISLHYLNYEYEDVSFVSTGRSALRLILEELEGNGKEKCALLPGFTCGSVIEPFVQFDYRVEYYRAGDDLTANAETLKEDIARIQPSVILLHRYFGFDTLQGVHDVLTEAIATGITVIEDMTQCLYSNLPRIPSNYLVGSFRKWTAMADGGFVVKRAGKLASHPKQADVELEKMMGKAMDDKYRFITHGIGDKDAFLQEFALAQDLLDSRKENYSMAPSSIQCQAGLDISALKRKRASNFRFLLEAIDAVKSVAPVFRSLPDEVCPLYFPVLCNGQRDHVQKILRENRVYAPIVWPRSAYMTQTSFGKGPYDDLLCIPCDQRYDMDDMQRIINVMESFL